MAFAGAWYPRSAAQCGKAIEALWPGESARKGTPAALAMAPHAGWDYSGALAARAVGALAHNHSVDLVVVLGGHLRPSDPVMIMGPGTWETPLGKMAIHAEFIPFLQSQIALLVESETHHSADNSLEVQLPFLKYAFPAAELIALRVPPNPQAILVGKVLERYLRANRLQAVGLASTDLTHYGPAYGFEPRGPGLRGLEWVKRENDPAFLRAAGLPWPQGVLDEALRHHNSCSPGAVAAALAWGGPALQFSLLGYTTSADSATGSGDNFVGYAAGVFENSPLSTK